MLGLYAMAQSGDSKSFRALPLHAAAGGCLGLGCLWAFITFDSSAPTSLSDGETIGVLSAVCASYFAVASSLTGFLFIANE
jgi:hypothetical protein